MNINDLKNRLQQLNRRTSKANDIWKPKDEHDIRLLPYKHGDDPLIERYFHYEIGDNQTILCPKMNFGDDCAVCEFCDKLKAWKDPEGNDKPERTRKEDWELFKKIQPKVRVFVPMVERTKEADGAKFWGITPNQAQALLEICSEGDRLGALGINPDDAKNALNVIFGIDKAFDLHISFAKPGEKGNTKTFGQVTIKGKIMPTAILADKKAAAALLDGMKKMDEVYPKMSSEEVSRIFAKFCGEGTAEAKPEGGVEKYEEKAEKPAAPNTKEDAKKVGGRSIDEAFGDMLGEDN